MRFRLHVRYGGPSRRRVILFASVMAILALGSSLTPRAHAKDGPSDLVVHEWGTFLSMSGSDGMVLDGMYHEEHKLPAFVHARSREQLRLPCTLIKGETPVIYFYSKERQNVRVGVGFPQGIWTQWYPQAAAVMPGLIKNAANPDSLRGGRVCWYAEIIPPSQVPREMPDKPGNELGPDALLPATSSDALWNYARDVDAAVVKTWSAAGGANKPEYERFLFYRGLGRSKLPLRFDATAGGTLALDPDPALAHGISHLFVIRIENGRGGYSYLPSLVGGQRVSGVIPSLSESQPLDAFTRSIADALANRLTDSGLYSKEARAMVNTWTTSYFQTEGVRVLYVLPQSWTDAFIPMTVAPAPKQIVRVMVGRVELLSPERERLAGRAVRDLADRSPEKRAHAYQFLREQGRYVEPIVRRVQNTTEDPSVRLLCRRLLLSEFVTELRAAIHYADDGKTAGTDPVLLKAELARLLRDLGLSDQARAEAEAALLAIKAQPTDPNSRIAENPDLLEVRAAAVEATGDDRKAAVLYARRLELQTRGWKGNIDPTVIAELRDWWVGRAYAQCMARTASAASRIAALEHEMSERSFQSIEPAAKRHSFVLLALLLESQRKFVSAERAWSLVATMHEINAAAAAPISKEKPVDQPGT
jgi:hypothetical protein